MAKPKRDKLPPDLARALKRFPSVVRTQERRAIQQRRFLKKTFGPLVKALLREQKRYQK